MFRINKKKNGSDSLMVLTGVTRIPPQRATHLKWENCTTKRQTAEEKHWALCHFLLPEKENHSRNKDGQIRPCRQCKWPFLLCYRDSKGTILRGGEDQLQVCCSDYRWGANMRRKITTNIKMAPYLLMDDDGWFTGKLIKAQIGCSQFAH